MAKISDHVTKWATSPMRPGEGLHVDIFRAAILLLEQGYSEDTVFQVLRRSADKVDDRKVPDREIHGAIRSAISRMNGDTILTPKWPPFSAALRAEIVAKGGFTLKQIMDSADSLPQDPVHYLQRLYSENEYVCIGRTNEKFSTVGRDEWINFLRAYPCEYINPSPMIAEKGITKDGRESAHALSNTGPKVYQVIEFDFGGIEEHAAIHMHLATKAKLIMMVYSGGKSLHGWYNVRSLSTAEQLSFFRSAVEIGADPKMYSAAQFSRLPAGQNAKTGKPQLVVAFEPAHL